MIFTKHLPSFWSNRPMFLLSMVHPDSMNKLLVILLMAGLASVVTAEPGKHAQKTAGVVSHGSSQGGSGKTDSITTNGLNTVGRSIMRLDEDVVVQGRPCKAGWLKLHPNGVPSSFTTSQEIRVGKIMLPADSWVMQDEKGVVLACALPRDMEIQGLMCRGTGGAKGVQIEFHRNGVLKRIHLVRDTEIQGVPCAAAGLLSGAVEFHEDGRLKSCKLSRPHLMDGVACKKGARIVFATENGRLLASD